MFALESWQVCIILCNMIGAVLSFSYTINKLAILPPWLTSIDRLERRFIHSNHDFEVFRFHAKPIFRSHCRNSGLFRPSRSRRNSRQSSCRRFDSC